MPSANAVLIAFKALGGNSSVPISISRSLGLDTIDIRTLVAKYAMNVYMCMYHVSFCNNKIKNRNITRLLEIQWHQEGTSTYILIKCCLCCKTVPSDLV